MKKTMALALVCLLFLSLISGCMEDTSQEQTPEQGELTDAEREVAKAALPDVNALPLVDNDAVYEGEEPASLVHFYATIRRGAEGNGTNHSLQEVDGVIHLQDAPAEERIKAEVLLQEGDEHGPVPGMLGYLSTEANGTIRTRGRTSTLAAQKSYRIDLFKGGEEWRGQRAIAMLKHPSDPSRMRNKIYFDLLRELPHMTSLRTQFVQLYVKDETANPPTDAFVDYGLFTYVETPNKRFLRSHGLSEEGDLYKANIFEFYRYEDVICLKTDPLYDEAAFEMILEPKSDRDHEKLIAMLDAVNDHTLPIRTVVETHFDVDNIMSFLAYNLLIGNQDFNSQNFYLYSPLNADTWYFLPWDGDGCLHFAFDEMMGRKTAATWQQGISLVWNVQLFQRMFRQAEYRDLLLARVEELRTIITPEKVAGMIAEYRTVVDGFTSRMPDTIYLPATLEQLEEIYARMPYDVDIAYGYIQQSMLRPMPFFLDDVTVEEGALAFYWGESFSFDGGLLTYDVQIASDPSFDATYIRWEGTDLLELGVSIPMLPSGDYWWRVQACNAAGETQYAFDYIEGPEGDIQEGMRKFRITQDGQVENDGD